MSGALELIRAGAGSGKTYDLCETVAAAVRQGLDPARIMATTIYSTQRVGLYTTAVRTRDQEPALGLSAPYHFLGPCKFVNHTGSRPISITWELLHSVPSRLLRTMARQVAA